MKNRIQASTLVLAILLSMLSCGKSNSDNPDNNNDGQKKLSGRLIYTFTGDVYQLDLKTNKKSTYFTYNTYGFNNWDMSSDGKYRLISEREGGVFDAAKITLIRNSDGKIVDGFDYVSPKGTDTHVMALLSPDNKKVLFSPTLENGIVITDMKGKILIHLEAVNTKSGPLSFEATDEVLWLPGNRIIFTLNEKYIFRSDPPYTSLKLVKEMPYTQWKNLRVNKQGTQLSIMVNNHIHVMDLDGKNFKQVTESSGGEMFADFSPDGKHFLVAKEIGPTYFYWNLAIIPNNGKVYNMDSDKEVIVIKPKGDDQLPAVDRATFWVE